MCKYLKYYFRISNDFLAFNQSKQPYDLHPYYEQ